MYSRPSAASDAENDVLAPISRAFALNNSKSLPVAPLIAATDDIADSKLAAVFTDLPKPTASAVPIATEAAPVFLIASNVSALALPNLLSALLLSAILRLKRSEEHTSELQSRGHLVCRLLLET